MDDRRPPIRFSPEEIESLEEERADATDPELTREELAELVAKNVPSDAHEFFKHYAREFCEGLPIDKSLTARLPNLMLLGYLLRVLEERLLVEPDESFDA